MTTIRKFVYATLLAATAMSFASGSALAQEAHGKFKLTHSVNWGSSAVPAGDYEFSYDPNQTSPVLIITKVNGARSGFMVLVPSAEVSNASASNQIVLETNGDGSYVSSMELASCGMILRFSVPSHPVKQLAKAVTTMAASGQ